MPLTRAQRQEIGRRSMAKVLAASTPAQRQQWARNAGRSVPREVRAETSRRNRRKYLSLHPPSPRRCTGPGCRAPSLLRGLCDACFRRHFRPPRFFLGVNR